MPLFIIAIGIVLLLILMIKCKLNGFISLVVVALAVGLMEGMSLTKVVKSLETGFGGTLGSLALILGFGAILGRLMADSGAAQRISNTLIDKFGKKRIQWAILLTGFISGIAMFYEIGFVVLIPLAFTIAVSADVPLLYVGVPMAAALSVCHGFLPPHPGPTAIAGIYNANLGRVLIYGLIIAIPTVIVAGPVFTAILKKMGMLRMEMPLKLFKPKIFAETEMPSFGISVFTGIVPVILMAVSAGATMTMSAKNPARELVNFVGDPAIAMLISVIVAIFTLGLFQGTNIKSVMKTAGDSVSSIAMILLIIGGGGGFKQVLIDSGVSQYIVHAISGSNISPILLAWLIAAVLRLALGSATVAAMTAAGIVAPLIATTGANPELLVLATGAGSLIFSHVNDAGFWMFKEYFGLTIPETLKSWSTMETIISVMGLGGTLLISVFVH